MIRAVLVLSMCLASVVFTSACASKPSIVVISPPQASAEVHLGSLVEVRLPENPSTGWMWRLESNYSSPTASVLQPRGNRFEREGGKDGLVGVGGDRIFTYMAVMAGEIELKYVLVGPGRPVESSDHRMEFRIQVTD